MVEIGGFPLLADAPLFRYRCRYFTDAGVLGSKRFVREVFEEIKGLLGSKRERQFVRVIGDAGVYVFAEEVAKCLSLRKDGV
jgi:hypothetical protein